MVSWSELEAESPELAAFARSRFDAHRHKGLATIRRDGSPRISGIEVEFRLGEMWIGSMPGARKGADLRRDPRLALHSGMDEPDAATGDAKVAGVAVLVDDASEVQAYLDAGVRAMEQPRAVRPVQDRHHRARDDPLGGTGGPPRDRIVARGHGIPQGRATLTAGAAGQDGRSLLNRAMTAPDSAFRATHWSASPMSERALPRSQPMDSGSVTTRTLRLSQAVQSTSTSGSGPSGGAPRSTPVRSLLSRFCDLRGNRGCGRDPRWLL